MGVFAPNPRLGKEAPNSNSGKGTSQLNSKLGCDVFMPNLKFHGMPNSMLGYGVSAPNPMLRQGHVHAQLHVRLWCARP